MPFLNYSYKMDVPLVGRLRYLDAAPFAFAYVTDAPDRCSKDNRILARKATYTVNKNGNESGPKPGS